MSRLSAEAIKAEALRMGFVACGIAALGPNQHGDMLDRWLKSGYGGTMTYLNRQARKRKEPALITPGARVAVVVLENYAPHPEELPQPNDAFKISCYARGTDYHIVTQARLDQLAEWMRQQGAEIAHARTDAGPVPERELAHRAGLGWIGKNAMLIHPQHGSLMFIGTIFTDLDLPVDEPMRSDHCGTCTRCLDACPTDAFVEPGVVDATRCLSYLTIEYKKEPPEELAARYEGWAFGCDICNQVCPWNIKFAEPTTITQFSRRPQPDRSDPHAFDDLDEESFAELYQDTPLMRPGLERMRRNLRYAAQSPHDS